MFYRHHSRSAVAQPQKYLGHICENDIPEKSTQAFPSISNNPNRSWRKNLGKPWSFGGHLAHRPMRLALKLQRGHAAAGVGDLPWMMLKNRLLSRA